MNFTQLKTLPRSTQILTLAVGTAALMYMLGLGILAFVVGPYDYNHLSTYYEIARRFWFTEGGWPQFNPFLCGGRTLGADPQIPLYHPIAFLSAVTGPVVALRWELLAQIGLGAWGLWQWLTDLRVTRDGKLWGSLLFLCGGFSVARVLVGHVTLGFYFLLPLYFWLSYRASAPRRFDAWSFLALVWLCVYCGLYKPNFFLYAVPPLFIEAIARSVACRSVRPVAVFSGAIGLGGLACAVALWPAAEYFAQFPRDRDVAPKSVPIFALLANLLLPLKSIPGSWYGPDFMQRHEYNVFVGPVVLFFAWRGMKPWVPQTTALGVFALFSAALGLGFEGSISPWLPFSWFHNYWPGFASIRVPVRFWAGVFFAAILFSARGFQWPKQRLGQILCVGLGMAPLLVQLAVNLTKINVFQTGVQWRPEVAYANLPELRHAPTDEPFAVVRSGNGTIECVTNLTAPTSRDLRPESLLAYESTPPNAWQIQWRGWSHIAIAGSAATETELTLNLNHHPYWKADGAEIVSQFKERLRLRIGPGAHAIQVSFVQPRVKEAGALSFLVISLLTIWSAIIWRRKRRHFFQIGLTGGIGSGKSEAARWFEKRGWSLVELDSVARTLTRENADVRQAIDQAFGKIDRDTLRERVFADPSDRLRLENILHPWLRRHYRAEVQRAIQEQRPGIVCEGATILEKQWGTLFDKILLITAPESIRLARTQARTGLTEAIIKSIMATQAPDSEKSPHADWVIENSGTIEELSEKLESLAAFGLQFRR